MTRLGASETAGTGTDAPVCYVTGMFDMANFGDLLFPLIARHHLARDGIEVVAVAPTAQAPGMADALRPIDVGTLIAGPSPDPTAGILIGGGYIVHGHRMDMLREYRGGDLGAWAGVSTWLGATLAAALRDCPVVWNAPGVPHPMPAALRGLAGRALAAADYLSVRDDGSRDLLSVPEAEGMAVVPDPAADIARMWPADTLEPVFRDFLARKSLGIPVSGTGTGAAARPLLSIQARRRSTLGTELAELAAGIDALARRLDAVTVLIGLGRSHGDDAFARRLAGHLQGPAVVLDAAASLAEIAAVISRSRLSMGSSLHGYVCATAYGTPSILVGKPAYRKFRGFIDHIGRRHDLARDWPDALDRAGGRLAGPLRTEPLPAFVHDLLDGHWTRIRQALAAGPDGRRPARMAFARAAMAAGMTAAGTGWAMRPFVNSNALAAAIDGSDVRGMEVW